MFEYRSGYFVAQPPWRSREVFDRLRAGYPQTVGGQKVLAVRDLGTGLDTAEEGGWAEGWDEAGSALVPAGCCGADLARGKAC